VDEIRKNLFENKINTIGKLSHGFLNLLQIHQTRIVKIRRIVTDKIAT
jgi:hypothetical protein